MAFGIGFRTRQDLHKHYSVFRSQHLRILVTIQQIGRELPEVFRNGTTSLNYKLNVPPRLSFNRWEDG